VGKQPAIYIMASGYSGTLYVGVTSNLLKRIWEHKNGITQGFTKKYNVKRLVYYELFENMENAILREKQLKGGSRKKKIQLIEGANPDWKDLYDEVLG